MEETKILTSKLGHTTLIAIIDLRNISHPSNQTACDSVWSHSHQAQDNKEGCCKHWVENILKTRKEKKSNMHGYSPQYVWDIIM